MNHTRVIAPVLSAAALLVATSVPAAACPVRAVGVASADGSGGAWTYDQASLPLGARLTVRVTYPRSGRTIVRLHVKGALPHRAYGAHAHVAACGAAPTAAGGHFQHIQGGATDPMFANPQNEIWLDLHTNAAGNGHAKAVVDWQPDTRRPASVVIHDHHTDTAPGTAGTAGPRLGCLTVPF